jgi:5-bromo-4-chloroindolyl phosphate hydrolysis protein
MPFIYEIAAAIQKAVEQAEAGFMKNGRKTIIEAEGLSEADCRVIEKAVQAMPGFINSTRKMYHNTKAVFEVLQAGTGYDLAEVLTEKFKKTNISIWKYSKNIVKLRVVKVKG